MAIYNYRVIVDVDVNASGTQSGVNENEKYLRKIEQQVLDSKKRMAEMEKGFARQKQDFHAAQYERELNQLRQHNQNMANERQRGASGATGAPPIQPASSPTGGTSRQPKTYSPAQYEAKIREIDPFQSLGGRQKTLEQAAKDIKAFDEQVSKSNKGMGMWATAFKGAFIGAVAGLTFSLLIGSIFSLIQATANAGISAVQAGARFQTTTKALEVFAGTTARARQELADIDAVARNTAGLRLEPAEKGYTQLRALGFAAEQAKGFIKELGEEKILSGASDESLERIIFNFAQIASGGQKVSQELREILTQMPSLGNAFFKAFGTLDPKKIQKFFDADTNNAFKRLTDTMAQQKAATGGLEDAWGKLSDQIILSGRDFSEPVLDPLTQSLKNLTKFMKENESTWKSWGQQIADTVEGINNAKPKPETSWAWAIIKQSFRANSVINNPSANQSEEFLFTRQGRLAREKRERPPTFDEYVKSQTGLTVDQIRKYDTEMDDLFRKYGTMNSKLPAIREPSRLLGLAENYTNLYQRPKSIADLRMSDDKALAMSDAEKLQQEKERLKKEETARKLELERIDAQYSQIKNIRENAFSLEVAQYQDNAQKVFEITDKNYSKEIDEAKAFFDKKIALNEGDDLEVYKLTVESNNTLRDLENKQAIERINFEREQFEKRRQNLLEFRALQIREVEQSFDKQNFDLQRAIDQENISIKAGYAEQVELANNQFNIISQITRAEYDLKLQQQGLTDQEIINLTKERDLALQDLAEQNRRKLLEIDDNFYKRQLQELDRQNRNFQERADALSNMFGATSNLFSPENIGKRAQTAIGDAFFGGDYESTVFNRKTDLDAQLTVQKTLRDILLSKYETQKIGEQEYRAQLELSDKAIKKIENDLNLLSGSYSVLQIEIYKVSKAFAEGTASTKDFDVIAKKILEGQQAIELAKINYEIDTMREKVNLAAEGKGGDRKEFERQLNLLTDQKVQLGLKQTAESLELYKKSLDGLDEAIEKLLSGDKTAMLGVQRIFDLSQRQELKSLLTDIRLMELEIASPDITAQYRIRADVLEHTIELRNEETEAVSRTMNALKDFERQFTYSQARADANVAEFIANQKGITEILSDARINAITTAYDGLDKVAQSLAKNFGFAAKAVEDLIASLLKLGLNYIFKKLLGNSVFGANSQQSGGTIGFPNFGTIGAPQGGGASGNILQTLGLGGYTTPPFNPNAGGGLGHGGIIGLGHDGSLLGAGTTNSSGGNFGGTGASALSGLGGTLGIGLTGGLFGAGLGFQLGGGRGLGGVLGIAGGGLLGVGGALIASGLMTGGLAGLTTAMAGTGIGLIGLPILIGAIIAGRNAARRRDEKTRNQAMIDAFKQIDDLIAKVNNDQMDGASALSAAQQIREQYVQSMSQLKDKKTRNIALKDVSRIDAKIATLNAAITNQIGRKERLEQSVPTFADGGNLSNFIGSSYKNNPLGYQQGGQSFGYFPNAGMIASYNEKGSEYILDAETTRNVGVHNLDRLRATKGLDMMTRSKMAIPQRDSGGTVTPMVSTSGQATGGGASGEPTIILNANITLGTEQMVELIAEMINQNDGSRKSLSQITANLKNDGGGEFVSTVMALAKAKGLVK